MRYVIDANALIAVCLRQPAGEKIAEILIDPANEIYAPDLIIPEFANALRKYFQARVLGIEEVLRAFDRGNKLVRELFPASLFGEEVLKLALDTGHSAYDFSYYALSARLKATIITLDTWLYAYCRDHSVLVLDL